jgi:enoyl-CoA hydratase/carnithine racemase
VFRAAGERDDVGALVIWGGPKIFAAGADIKAIAEFDPGRSPGRRRARRRPRSAGGDAEVSIAAINGYALGGGSSWRSPPISVTSPTTGRWASPRSASA